MKKLPAYITATPKKDDPDVLPQDQTILWYNGDVTRTGLIDLIQDWFADKNLNDNYYLDIRLGESAEEVEGYDRQ